MEILERPYGMRAGFAPLDNIGFCLLEVNLEGEVYTYSIPGISEHCKVERVGDKWKIRKYDFSGNPIEYVIPRNVLVGFGWYNIKESLWENSIYSDTIRRYKEFFSIPCSDKDITDYKTKNGFHYYVTKFGEVWNTERMTKVNGSVKVSTGYRDVALGSEHDVSVHRLVAHHFVPKPKDLVDQGLKEDDLVVNHLDGNKLNNRWDNLEWTTYKGNTAHAYSIGLIPTTIDDHLLEHIFKRLEEGWPDIDISKETGISVKTVSSIRRGGSPRYITDKYTWPKSSIDARMKESRELAMKCVEMYNQGMTYKAIADKLGFNSLQQVFKLIDKYRDLVTRKPQRKLDEATILSIYDDFTYTDMKNYEIARKYNVSDKLIYALRRGCIHSDLAREYITSKGLDSYWQGYRHPK